MDLDNLSNILVDISKIINMKIEVMHVLCALKFIVYLCALVLGPEVEEIKSDFKVNIPWQNNFSLFSFCVCCC